MRKGFIIFALFVSALSLAACSGKPPANSNSNTAATETPLPEFTDANEALTVGTKLFDDGQTELAIEAFQQAVKLNPDLAEAYFKMGIAYGLIENARKNTAAPMEPEDANSNSAEAKEPPKTDSQKAFIKAVAAYHRIIDQNSKDDVAYYNLGRAYSKLNKDEDAEKALRQAVKLKPDDTEYQTELGDILIKLAQYPEAVGVLKKAIELDPDNLAALDLLEDAEAGRRRTDYVSPKKDDKKLSNSNTNSASTPGVSGSPGSAPPPPTPSGKDPKAQKPPPTPAKPTPKPHVH
ncbi:MAG TPA: tetratricopeptide repeat protein [Nitrosospira sp.]|jgi:tetratricopeptide (TPR) repeat protein|nr:tetratricopeptide repeat protein [Nitrosospira sp.]